MKVIIEDLVKHHSGLPETELPENTTIRFEVGDKKFSVKISKDGIEIYKVSWSGLDTVLISPNTCNNIHVL